MPITILSHGFEKPTNPTYGDLWFPAMERNWDRVNAHNHDGSNSARIGATTQTVLSGNWGADLGGSTYRQTINLPAGVNYDDIRIEVRRSTGEVVYPTIERASATSLYIYTNDNTAAYVLSYV